MKKIIFVMGIFLCSISAHGSELMTSAKELGIGRINGVAYYTASTKEIDLGEWGTYDFLTNGYAAKVSLKLLGGWNVYA